MVAALAWSVVVDNILRIGWIESITSPRSAFRVARATAKALANKPAIFR
jgi:hypothetical protein